ncbi:hypothetical protein DSL92_04260 [Billgrantia gudaonensis]|uniref:Uncharacterized protein n=1 Tax=Billgrantia gudaonensis TaxID=376427 RepID=A0A432JJF2_9GAMM|nr:hypothetical protein DSL92_04260 [Halomonas gudaonensis]
MASRQNGEAHPSSSKRCRKARCARTSSQAIRSMVTVPIMVNGRWWGTLGIDDCERPRLARRRRRRCGRHRADRLGHLPPAAHRGRQIELFQRVTDCGIWEVDPRSGTTWCSRALLRTLELRTITPGAHTPLLAHIAREIVSVSGNGCDAACAALPVAGVSMCLTIANEAETRWHGSLPRWSGPQSNTEPGGTDHRRNRRRERALVAARYDKLTGTLNRRGLWRHLDKTLVYDDHTPPPAAAR